MDTICLFVNVKQLASCLFLNIDNKKNNSLISLMFCKLVNIAPYSISMTKVHNTILQDGEATHTFVGVSCCQSSSRTLERLGEEE